MLDIKSMISNSYPNSNFGNMAPSPSIPKGTILNSLIKFMQDTLLEFQNFYVNEMNDSEEEISQFVINFFSALSKSESFIFCKEVSQKPTKGHARRADFGVFMHHFNRSPFYTIEAKRLPPPSKSREKEYVIGSNSKKPSGGIERYKLNLHGIGLNESAIIAYVHKNNFIFWHNQINAWIDELIQSNKTSASIWNTNDKLFILSEISPDRLCKFESTSLRKDGTSINLLHYFINISSPSS
ncbi:hypothetical protein [Hymenobacter crusticola]|uniref:hypothetical protein n=1 Tax=Hymenobacter crusticola TaxID=1770526 RepID=UPI00117A4A78|nr:hypothetical protein [Hymenobacter crusticola]